MGRVSFRFIAAERATGAKSINLSALLQHLGMASWRYNRAYSGNVAHSCATSY